MSKWNGKLKCINNDGWLKERLTKGKEYLVVNGVFYFDNGNKSSIYDNYEELIDRNYYFSNSLIEISAIKQAKPEQIDWYIEQNKLAKYITINDTMTIAIPIDTPMGISFKHPNDEYDEEMGQALALKRMLEISTK